MHRWSWPRLVALVVCCLVSAAGLHAASAAATVSWYDRLGIRTGYIGAVAGGLSQGAAATSSGAAGAIAAIGDRVFYAGSTTAPVDERADYLGVLDRSNARVSIAGGLGDCLPAQPTAPVTSVARLSRLCVEDLAADPSSGRVYILDYMLQAVLALEGGRLHPVPGLQGSALVGLAVGPAGSLYIAEYSRILRRTPDGVITVIAGGGDPSTPNEGDGLPATLAPVTPKAIAVDDRGDVFFTETSQRRVREIDAAGIIHTIAGGPAGVTCGDDGPSTLAALSTPGPIAADVDGNLYFGDGDQVRRIDPLGHISTVYGRPCPNSLATPPDWPPYGHVGALAGDPSGGLLIGVPGGLLSVKGSQVQELIGSDYNGGYGDGGYARHAPVGGSGIVADGSGGLYVLNGSYLRWISPSGTLHTVGGDHPVSPVGIAPAPNHQVYAAEASGDIYRVDHSGESHLIASNLIGLMSSLGSDPFGNIYIGAVQDPRQPSSILKISPTGTITMIAGGGVATNGASPDGTPAIGAVLISVSSVTYWHGRVVFTESDLPYPRVVAINADGRLATLASEGCACYAIPNWALTPAADGNLYFLSGSRGGWSSLERILPTGQVAEVAIGDNDGYASDAPRPLDHRLPHPALSLGAGPGNRLFIGEYQRVRMLRL